MRRPTYLLLSAWLLALSSITQPRAVEAQTSSALTRAAASITPADLRRRINLIADDSMLGRDTPSRGLELTAAYVADQFRNFGLKPGGDSGSFIQRYQINRTELDLPASRVDLTANGRESRIDLTRDARLSFGTVPAQPVGGPVVLLGGPFGTSDVEGLNLTGKVVLIIMDYGRPPPPATQRGLDAVVESGVVGAVLVSNRDSLTFARRVAAQGGSHVSLPGGTPPRAPFVEVHQRALAEFLAGAGVDLAQIRAATTPTIRELAEAEITLDLRESILEQSSAPNTVGILEGSDPRLRQEYVVFSAHMDHIGISPGQADSINNGADDDGSGTVGVIELAEAFSRPGARPRRSMMFLTVSGEEKGLWGSNFFTENPPVPLASMAADLNIDMIGRNWKDTIVAIGTEHSDLGTTLRRVGAAHRELQMTAVPDRWPEENFYFRSDHYNFAKRGVPILFFFNGVHEDYHQPSDSPDKIDTEKESRILQLLFYLGQEVANNPKRPQWDPDSYRRIVEGKR